MVLGQLNHDAVRTGQKVLLPISQGVLHDCLSPRHKGRAGHPSLVQGSSGGYVS